MTTEWRMTGCQDGEPLHYNWCGLDDVYLRSGFDRVAAGDGTCDVIIHDLDGLHEAIATYLASNKKALNGKEVRFLRHQMDLTQAELGDLLRVTDQTVARWEKGEFEVNSTAELLLRVIYLGHRDQELDVQALAAKLRALDERAGTKQLFEDTAEGWRPAVAA